MKKQNIFIKIVGLQVFTVLILQLVTMVFHTPLSGNVYAAAARCYIGDYGSVVAQTQCPTPTSSSSDIVRYSDGGPKDTTPATCYGSPAATPPGSGPRTVSYAPASCDTLDGLAKQYIQSRCTTSGGTWGPQGSDVGNARGTITCNCPSGQNYTNYICSTTTTGGTTGTTGDSSSPKPVDSKCPLDDATTAAANGCCLANDVNKDNCGIIKYINIAFNFVSGGVTLAIIGNIIFAGVQYSTAQGDPSAVGKSKKRIRDALIAFLMFLSLYGFIQWLIPGGVF